jgi:hypothetical protein
MQIELALTSADHSSVKNTGTARCYQKFSSKLTDGSIASTTTREIADASTARGCATLSDGSSAIQKRRGDALTLTIWGEVLINRAQGPPAIRA